MKNIIFLSIIIAINCISCKDHVAKKELAEAEETVELVSTLTNPTTENSATPRLFTSNSKLYMSWVTNLNDEAQLKFASYNGQSWSEPTQVANGTNWFNNWADFPTITESNNNILTTYLQKSAPDTYTYDVKINVYNDSIKKWKKNLILHTDGTKSEHGFVSAIPDNEGGFFVSWLDGRNTVGSDHQEDKQTSVGAMTLRTARISSLGIISQEQEVDARVCDCCSTSMAMSTKGPVVVFRDRSEDEIRDISISRMIDSTWTQPQTIYKDNWEISGCPVNGPVVSAFEGQLAVAWFTGVNEKPKVKLVFSENDGESFGVPIRIDSNMTLGRVDVNMINKDEAVVSWMELLGDETLIQLMKVNRNGSKGNVVTLSNTTTERASGFPQIKILNNKIIAAMTIIAKDKPSTIKTVSVDFNNL